MIFGLEMLVAGERLPPARRVKLVEEPAGSSSRPSVGARAAAREGLTNTSPCPELLPEGRGWLVLEAG